MRYWVDLSWRYMRKNCTRTMYSVFGILITFILCFSIFTVGYSWWDYQLQLRYSLVESQLYLSERTYNAKEITRLKALEKEANVQNLVIFDRSAWVMEGMEESEEDEGKQDTAGEGHRILVSEMQENMPYTVDVNLKDTSDLQRSAKEIEKKYGFQFTVYSQVEMLLHQGDSQEGYFYSACVAMIGSVFALFSIMILRNTMMISVVERMKDYGLFRCVGMSKKQLYELLLTEGLFISLAAALGGVVGGYAILQGIGVWINRVIKLDIPFTFGFYPRAVLYTTLLMIAVTLFSLLEPARQAGMLSPVEAIQNNVVLRRRNGKLRETIRYHQGRILGKVFGAPGEYAYKNMCRNRGRFVSLFIGLTVCIALVVSVQSLVESFYASCANEFQGKNQECLETVSMKGNYDARAQEAVGKELEKYEDVEGTNLMMTFEEFSSCDSELQKQRKTEAFWFRVHYAYDKKHVDEFKRYLIEGDVNYEEMTRKNGVLLCDMTYNVSNRDTDFNQMDLRKTSYKIGDKISMLSEKGEEQAKNIYYAVIKKVAEKNGLLATEWEARKQATYSTDDGMEWPISLEEYSKAKKGFKKYREQALLLLKEQGYDVTSVVKKSKITAMADILQGLRQMEYNRGERREYVILGIISEDIFNGARTDTMYAGAAIELIHARDAAIAETEEFATAGEKEKSQWNWEIGVIRNGKVLDDEIKNYCEENSFIYETIFDDNELEDYFGMIKTLRTVRVSAILFSVCIGLICLVQIMNTLYANMALRQKELWLYTVVGMSPGQRKAMLLLEHTATALFAMFCGCMAAWGISWCIVEYILNQEGNIIYVWSWSALLPAGVVLLVLVLGISILGLLHCIFYGVVIH